MHTFSLADFQAVLREDHPNCLSLYIPTEEVGAEGKKRDVHLKDSINQALECLRQTEIKETLLKKLKNVEREMTESDEFWKQGNRSFTIFISPELSRWYRLPIRVLPLAVFSHRFHLKPLLPLVTQPFDFYLLSLSQKKIELLKGNRYGLEKVQVPDLPHNLIEVVGEETGEHHLQFHTGTTGQGGGRRPAVFHGHSSWKDDKQKLLVRFLNQVDNAVTKYLHESTAPLIVTGVEKMRTEYQRINTYAHFLPDKVLKGKTTDLSLTLLHAKACTVLEPYFYQQQTSIIDKYLHHGDPNKFSYDVAEVIREAKMGRVDTVLVAKGVREWGDFNPNTLQVSYQNYQDHQQLQNLDLLDLACAETILSGGKAYSLPPDQIPQHRPLVAIFRY